MPKLNEVAKATTMNSTDYIPFIQSDGGIGQIKRGDLAIVMADVMRLASSEKNGLMPAGIYGRVYGGFSFLILDSERVQTNVAILLAISDISGGSLSLYFISINRGNTTTKPTVTVKVLSGNDRMKVKLLNDDATGRYKIFIERTQYTPTCAAYLFSPHGTEKLSMSQAIDQEVNQAEYVLFIN